MLVKIQKEKKKKEKKNIYTPKRKKVHSVDDG